MVLENRGWNSPQKLFLFAFLQNSCRLLISKVTQDTWFHREDTAIFSLELREALSCLVQEGELGYRKSKTVYFLLDCCIMVKTMGGDVRKSKVCRRTDFCLAAKNDKRNGEYKLACDNVWHPAAKTPSCGCTGVKGNEMTAQIDWRAKTPLHTV